MLIALTALLAQFAVILTHRRVNKVRTRPEPPVLYTMLCLFGIAVGWLSIGRPEITWSTSVLVLLSGLLITAEAADATAKLGAPLWLPAAVCVLCGAASTTWLLSEPVPYL
ncbi:hypothetical protein AB0O32_38370 [Streptomyces rubiginosohelvolus]|uniref:hypothetical protein n=1 Tax=Streptomyces rubiginosohelvolus TaxID=67362 RepID=UPI00342498B0